MHENGKRKMESSKNLFLNKGFPYSQKKLRPDLVATWHFRILTIMSHFYFYHYYYWTKYLLSFSQTNAAAAALSISPFPYMSRHVYPDSWQVSFSDIFGCKKRTKHICNNVYWITCPAQHYHVTAIFSCLSWLCNAGNTL